MSGAEYYIHRPWIKKKWEELQSTVESQNPGLLEEDTEEFNRLVDEAFEPIEEEYYASGKIYEDEVTVPVGNTKQSPQLAREKRRDHQVTRPPRKEAVKVKNTGSQTLDSGLQLSLFIVDNDGSDN